MRICELPERLQSEVLPFPQADPAVPGAPAAPEEVFREVEDHPEAVVHPEDGNITDTWLLNTLKNGRFCICEGIGRFFIGMSQEP